MLPEQYLVHTRDGSAATFDGIEKVHGDVLDDDVVAAVLLGAVVDHDVAEGAGGGDPPGASADEFLRPFGVDLLAGRLLHPHAGSAGAAAETAGAVARRLHDVDALQGTEHLPRRGIDVVVAAEVTRVVV